MATALFRLQRRSIIRYLNGASGSWHHLKHSTQWNGRALNSDARYLSRQHRQLILRSSYSKVKVIDEQKVGFSTEKKHATSPQNSNNQSPTPKLRDRLRSLTPYENIYTVPNILTFSRLISAPVVGYLVLHDQHALAIGLFAYAGVTDLIDGWIARRWNLQTVVGTVIDPMADKALMTIVTVCLAINGGMPEWLAGIILGRDVLLAISAIYYRYISLPLPKTFARYWDFSLPSAEVHPTGISKINTGLQLGLIGWSLAMPLIVGFGPWLQTGLLGMQYLVATTTVWSGASYVYNKDAVKILTPEEIEARTRSKNSKESS